MSKIIDKIVSTPSAPENKNVIWDNGKELKINRQGVWKNISEGGSIDLDSIIEDIETLKESKLNTIPITTYSSDGINPNVYYKYTCSSTDAVVLKFNTIEDITIYNEYIIEINCSSTPASISFVNSSDNSEMSIIWANGTAPTFTEGNTYIISIANGLGVYSTFPNS